MTLYAVFAYEDEAAWAHLTPQEQEHAEQAYGDYTRILKDGDHNRGWQALEPTASGATVQVRDGATLRTDGPFMETKEALGSVYIVEAADLQEAVALAALCPSAAVGYVHVRPIMYSSKEVSESD